MAKTGNKSEGKHQGVLLITRCKLFRNHVKQAIDNTEGYYVIGEAACPVCTEILIKKERPYLAIIDDAIKTTHTAFYQVVQANEPSMPLIVAIHNSDTIWCKAVLGGDENGFVDINESTGGNLVQVLERISRFDYQQNPHESFSPYSSLVDQVHIKVHTDLSRYSSLNSLAAELDVSKSYLSRLYKSETGETISSFIDSVRENTASAKLIEGSMRIKEVAYYIGFDSPEHFTRWFKKRFGTTPSIYKQQKSR